MADAGVSSLLLFITSLIVAAGVAGVFATEVSSFTNDIDDLGFDASNKVRADIEIVSDTGSQMYDLDGNGEIRVYVKNTGVRELDAETSQIDVLVDGEFQPEADLTVTVLEDTDWSQGRVVRIDIAEPGLSSGTHRVQVGVDGDTEVVEFTV